VVYRSSTVVETERHQARFKVQGMPQSAQLIEYSGACYLCYARISTTVPAGASLRDSAQRAVLGHIKLLHPAVLEHVPVASIGQLVSSSAKLFTVISPSALALSLA
jgi:hypothetical protein